WCVVVRCVRLCVCVSAEQCAICVYSQLWFEGYLKWWGGLRPSVPLHVALRKPAHLPLAAAMTPALLPLHALVHLRGETHTHTHTQITTLAMSSALSQCLY